VVLAYDRSPSLHVGSIVLETFVRRLIDERDELAKCLRETAAERDLLDERVELLKKEVARLKAKLEEAERTAKRQAAPHARRKHKKHRKRPGRKPGHAAAHHSRPDEADDVDAPLGACPHCGGPVEDVHDLDPQVVIDVPADVKPKVTRYHNQSGWCPRCKRHVRSRHPDQHSDARGAAGVQVGPRALSLGVDLKHRVGVTYTKVTQVLELFVGLRICAATLVRAEKRIAARCEPTCQALVEVVRDAPAAESDETGWYITEARWLGHEGRPWLWVIATPAPKVTLYMIRMSRGSDVPLEVLAGFDGALGVDGWAGYINVPYLKGQDTAHLLRRCGTLLEVQQRGAARFPHAVKRVLKMGMEVKKLHGALPPEDYAACADQVRGEMTAVLDGRIEEEANLRFAQHLRNHEQELFTYLDVPALPPTTALVEQEVRPAVVVRKMSGGNRRFGGAHVHEVLRTVGRTAERNGKRLLDLLPALLCSVIAGHVLPLLPGLPAVIEPSRVEDWVHGLRLQQGESALRGTRRHVRRERGAPVPHNGADARSPPG
jgi:transposase